jgi:undecaprenyl-diphosphatase
MIEFLDTIDKNLFLFLNSLHAESVDGVMWWISAKYSWLPFYAVIIGYLIYAYRVKAIMLILIIALLITASDQGSVHLFKNVFERLRPCHNPELEGLVHLVNDRCGGKFGFVSSHAANAFALASFLIPFVRYKWAIFVLLFWAAIVGYSRIYLGVHYPGDIIGGAAFGCLLGFIFNKGMRVLRIHPVD